ncbi:hypothetical protein NOVO_07050 [Rickettsiales bacterium Ac37b]|nr:hypothetical protein NOVO_07050 [Rickettsiales bacterium Ac37b]
MSSIDINDNQTSTNEYAVSTPDTKKLEHALHTEKQKCKELTKTLQIYRDKCEELYKRLQIYHKQEKLLQASISSLQDQIQLSNIKQQHLINEFIKNMTLHIQELKKDILYKEQTIEMLINNLEIYKITLGLLIQYSGIQYTIEKAQTDYNNAFDQLQNICQKYINSRHKIINCSQKTIPLIKNAHSISYEDIQEKIYGNIRTPGFKTKLIEIHQNNPENVLSVLIDLIQHYGSDSSKKSYILHKILENLL